MNEGVHFDTSYTSGYSLGFKLISVNVSDIYAMGGSPIAVFLNVGLPPNTKEVFFSDFYDGIYDATNLYNIELLGGDLCGVKKNMTFSATLIGKTDRHILRKGAAVGDKVCVSGTLGDSALGLRILQSMSKSAQTMVKSKRDLSLLTKKKVGILIENSPIFISMERLLPFISHHLRPVAKRLRVVEQFATSCIDLSDGLSIDINRICDESKVGVCINLNKIPVSEGFDNFCKIMRLNRNKLVLNGGEDYRLLFTLPPYAINEIKKTGDMSEDFYIIGEIVENKRIYIDAQGNHHKLTPKGFEHFE